MASITIRNLVKRYGDYPVIPDLNLEIADHEFVVFVGPSAAANRPCCGSSRAGPISAGDIFIGRIASTACRGQSATSDGVPGLCALSAHARLRQHVFALELRGVPKPKSTSG